jgi:predicted transport protein
MFDALAASMASRTGRTLEEWVDLVGTSGVDPLDQNAVRRWLKETHGLPQNSQWAVADAAARRAGWTRPTVEQYVAEQYRGAKAALRPVFEAVRAAVLELGDDVTVEGRGGYVPFVRRRQFAAVAAATARRVDVGLRLPDPPANARLRPASGPGSATHKVALSSPDEVDDELRGLLRAAYDQNG